MFQRVLFPLDGSKLAERSLGLRARVAADGAEHVLLRVIPEGAPEAPADAYLAQLCEGLRAGGLAAVPRLRAGDPAEQILDEAHALRPCLVAMASHGRSGVDRLVRGSVAERVLRGCQAPLLLVTPHALRAEQPFKRVLVPHDGSERADALIPLLAQLAPAWEAELTLLHVLPLPPPLPSPYFLEHEWSEERVRERLAPSLTKLTEAGLSAKLEVATGYPATEILRAAADDTDLIAISTHGRTGASRWWFGSVAEQVLRHCEVPLLVQRADGED